MISIQLEIYYNYGRLYQELGMNHLSVFSYHQILEIVDENKLDRNHELSVINETAHNLVVIYRSNPVTMDLAYDIMSKYLTF